MTNITHTKHVTLANFLFDLYVLGYVSYITSVAKMLIKLLQSRLYSISLNILHCGLTCLLATGCDMQQRTYLHATITSIHSGKELTKLTFVSNPHLLPCSSHDQSK